MAAVDEDVKKVVTRLDSLYSQANQIMQESDRFEDILPTLNEIKELSVEVDRIVIMAPAVSDENARKEFMTEIKRQHAKRAEFDTCVSEWLQKLNLSNKDIASVLSAPRTLRSRFSKSSRESASSSVSKARALAKEEVARLKLLHLQERQKLEAEEAIRKREEKHKRELLLATQELKEASLERQVLEEELDRGGCIPSPSDLFLELPKAEQQAFQPKFNKDIPKECSQANARQESLTLPHLRTERRLQEEQLHSMASAIKNELELPKIEFLKFKGDPMQYTQFMKVLELNVERAVCDPSRKLLLLIQHCKGEAKRMIEFCLLLEPDLGYQKAKEVLLNNFGRKNIIARAFIEKLQKGHQINSEDSKGLIDLSKGIEECEVTLESLRFQSNLNNYEIMAKIIKRLPFSSQSRWLRVAANIERHGEDPQFTDLVKFDKEEAEVAKCSFAGILHQKSNRFSKFMTHSTALEKNKTQYLYHDMSCSLCSQKHNLWDCVLFKNKILSDRVAYMQSNRLCDNCFKHGHIARFCRSNKVCSIVGCGQKHHKLFHVSKVIKLQFWRKKIEITRTNFIIF